MSVSRLLAEEESRLVAVVPGQAFRAVVTRSLGDFLPCPHQFFSQFPGID